METLIASSFTSVQAHCAQEKQAELWKSADGPLAILKFNAQFSDTCAQTAKPFTESTGAEITSPQGFLLDKGSIKLNAKIV